MLLTFRNKGNNHISDKNTISENQTFNKIVQCDLNNTVWNLAEDSIYEMIDTLTMYTSY